MCAERVLLFVAAACLSGHLLLSCAGGRKLSLVKESGITAEVAVGSLDDVSAQVVADTLAVVPDVLEVHDLNGNRIIMNAVLDEESGEMVASEELEEIVVEAKFRHVAERNGVVDLVFELAVPEQLQKSMWQVRFTPKFAFLGDTLCGDKIFITGEKFRKVQDWEYMMYRNYVDRIVPGHLADSVFGREKMKTRFLSRNKGVEESVAALHYRADFLEKINRRLERSRMKVYGQFVVDPYPTEGVRLDSVVADSGTGQIRYFYVQTLPVQAGLKRVDMVMDGQVHTNGRMLCSLKSTSPITFYISSISSFADNTERYLKKVVARDLHFETMYNIGFAKGDWRVDPVFEDNAAELASLKENLVEICGNEDFVLDSILISAACSPEGDINLNRRLSRQRGESIRQYVMECLQDTRDSLREDVWEINEDETCREKDLGVTVLPQNNIRITGISEDWETLFAMMEADTLVENERWRELARVEDMDARETVLRGMKEFGYVKEKMYPRLRRVRFNFKMHRKGMLKDTVYTTVLDSVYMRGVEALLNREYSVAVKILRPYRCFNTAVAYVCMDYNSSALEILNGLPRDARRDYMLAVVYGRLGEEKKAVEYFLNSVEQDEQMRYRGNLDPEISMLIKKYGMFN